MIKLYGVHIDSLPEYSSLLALLREDWRRVWLSRYGSVRDERKKRAGLAGLWLLEHSGANGMLFYDANGRPGFLDGAVDFSISHTQTLVVCAVEFGDGEGGESPRIGVDAEDLSRVSPEQISALAERWFTEGEREMFLAAPNARTFLRIWTRKEALVKRTGEGLRGMRLRDVTRGEQEGITFFEYDADGALVTVCAHVGARTPLVLEWQDAALEKMLQTY